MILDVAFLLYKNITLPQRLLLLVIHDISVVHQYHVYNYLDPMQIAQFV